MRSPPRDKKCKNDGKRSADQCRIDQTKSSCPDHAEKQSGIFHSLGTSFVVHDNQTFPDMPVLPVYRRITLSIVTWESQKDNEEGT